MAQGQVVVYYRAGAAKLRRPGLGLGAQQEAVRRCLNGGSAFQSRKVCACAP